MILRNLRSCPAAGCIMLALAGASVAQQAPKAPVDQFVQSIRPVLAQNCAACHNPANPRNRINFLKATTSKDVQANRGLWRDVAIQLRNRTMPPVETKLTEEDRLKVATWIELTAEANTRFCQRSATPGCRASNAAIS